MFLKNKSMGLCCFLATGVLEFFHLFFFTPCKYLFSYGNLLCFFVGNTCFTPVFTAGFVKPGLEIFSKHYKSIITANLAYYAAFSYLALSIAPVKIS